MRWVVALWFLFLASAAQAESTFAEIDANGVVLRVIVADQKFISEGRVGDTTRWVQTYQDGTMRKNYAGIGYVYDKSRDAFIPPRPYPSWSLNEATARWEAPVPYPLDGKSYRWNDVLRIWVLQ